MYRGGGPGICRGTQRAKIAEPMRKMVATFDLTKEGKQTIVDCEMEYDMKMGFLLNPLAKGQMRKAIASMLAGVEAKL